MEIDDVFVIVDDVFKNRSVVEGIVNVGLGFFGEIDGFGVATSFDVEDSGVGPDVFIVSDEHAGGVGGEGGFTGAGKAEEDGGAIGLRVSGGRAVHGEVSLERHEVVHQGKDALLHFSGVFGAEDDHFLGLEADIDGGFGGHTRSETVGGKLAGIVDGKVGLAKVFELLFGRGDEHDTHEERVVGAGADDADLDPFGGIPTGEGIDDVKLLTGVEVVLGAFAIDFEGVGIDGDVDVTPPDVVLGGGIFGDPFVTGGAAGLFAGVCDEGSLRGKARGGFVADGVHIEAGHRGVANDVFGVEAGGGKIN